MTDEEIVKRAKEAEKRTGFGRLVHSPVPNGVNSAYGIGFIEGMVEYRNSLQEAPVSKELEEIAWNYADKKCHLDIAVFYPDEVKKERGKMQFVWQDLYDAVMFGAQWHKEQFEKNRLAACDKQTEEEAKIEFDFVMGIVENEHRQPTFDDAIKYGMKLKEKEMQSTIELAEDHAMLAGMEKMKEEMMAKAIDVEVKVDAGGYPYIPQIELYDYDKDVPLAKEGDKYKVVLIKE